MRVGWCQTCDGLGASNSAELRFDTRDTEKNSDKDDENSGNIFDKGNWYWEFSFESLVSQ